MVGDAPDHEHKNPRVLQYILAVVFLATVSEAHGVESPLRFLLVFIFVLVFFRFLRRLNERVNSFVDGPGVDVTDKSANFGLVSEDFKFILGPQPLKLNELLFGLLFVPSFKFVFTVIY